MYIYHMYTYICKYIYRERAGALCASSLLGNELQDSFRKECQNIYAETVTCHLMYYSFSICNVCTQKKEITSDLLMPFGM